MKRLMALSIALIVTSLADAGIRQDRTGMYYTNPIIYSDYSDPDVCRVGDDYYMTSSSFNCVPGLQILHSRNLVDWTIVGAALPYGLPPVTDTLPQHGKRVFAPCIRHHDGKFYIYWGDPDQGIFMVSAEDPEGRWSEPVLVKAGKGMIDPSPLWDEDGKVYLVHAYAGSRAQFKSVLAVCELNSEGTKATTPSRIIFDGHEGHRTCEGPKFYRYNGKYYIFFPAGGVATGWQSVLRSDSVYGPYECRIVMEQGKSPVNGPHQGAWIETPKGEHWFFHFQDVGVHGRIVHLQPMEFREGWPVIGNDPDGNGCGEPVARHRMPDTGYEDSCPSVQTSDEFDSFTLQPQWQWQGNFNEKWLYCAGNKGFLRLYSHPLPEGAHNLWNAPNLLLQKTAAPDFEVTAKISFSPCPAFVGERAGLVMFGTDYSTLEVRKSESGLQLVQTICEKANKGLSETIAESIGIDCSQIHMRVRYETETAIMASGKSGQTVICKLSYSRDGKEFIPFGKDFHARQGIWVGTKVGLFCVRPQVKTNDCGWMDVEWFRVRITDN